MKKTIFSFLILVESFSGISQLYTPGGGVTDIDGNNYSTIIINGQEWMSENLRTTSYANGDPIPNVTDNTLWSNQTSGAWAHYSNDDQYENPFGKLYNWYTVADSRNVCPTGWHVPSDEEWSIFINYLDPNADGGYIYPNIAGGKMKSTGTQYWVSPNTGATNESGFSGLPGNYRGFYDGTFMGIGFEGSWWCSSEYTLDDAWFRSVDYDKNDVYRGLYGKTGGFSVRCFKEQNVSINENRSEAKILIKIVNSLGIESQEKVNELLLYIYNDGSVEKKVIVE
jgi:uncharacterized protein (TIGR02145 family)